MGVRFQSEPNTPPSVIILHVRMWDKENVLQQQALGIVGVNLVFGAFWRKFAQTAKGASWMIFPSASFTDSSPSTFRSCSKEIRLVPSVTYFFAQLYRRREYWLRSPILAGFSAIYSGKRFFDSSQMRSKRGL